MLDIGDRIPDLPLQLSGGTAESLAAFAGRWLVLYFYPKDSTPGCTNEGIDFNALLPQFRALGAEVLGVSRDSLGAHERFRDKHGFAFPLASDPDQTLCQAFDVIREKNMYGRLVLGIERSTFLIAPDGRITKVWRKVKVPGHAQAVLAALTEAAR